MDDLLKEIEGQSAKPTAQGAGDVLGGLLGGGGLGNVVGGAVGGGLGGSIGGGLGGLVGGGLGAALPALLPAILGMLGGGAGNGQSGLHQLIEGMEAHGLGNVAGSWVGTGTNQSITPAQLEQAIGPDKVQALGKDLGLSPEQTAQGLSAILPAVVSHLTPTGQLPSAAGVQAAVSELLGSRATP